jgi:hypothetical protein
MVTGWLFPVRVEGGVYIVAWPLGVCGALSVPQLPGFWHCTDQSTPLLLGSLLITAVKLLVALTRTDAGGRG